MLKDFQKLREQIDGSDLGTRKLVCKNQCRGTGPTAYIGYPKAHLLRAVGSTPGLGESQFHFLVLGGRRHDVGRPSM